MEFFKSFFTTNQEERIQKCNTPKDLLIKHLENNRCGILRRPKNDKSQWKLVSVEPENKCIELMDMLGGPEWCTTDLSQTVYYSWNFISRNPGTALVKLQHLENEMLLEEQTIKITVE